MVDKFLLLRSAPDRTGPESKNNNDVRLNILDNSGCDCESKGRNIIGA